MSAGPWVTLLSDFGTRDWFAGAMRAVLARLAPQARVVDLCHGVPRHDMAAGAFILHSNFGLYPQDTIHVAVVDPGVGTARRGALVRARGHWFVGPDNGLLEAAIQGGDPRRDLPGADADLAERGTRCAVEPAPVEVTTLDPTRAAWRADEGAPPPSHTFHGRDLFAAAAARLAAGTTASQLGSPGEPLVRGGDWWSESADRVCARVLWIDSFGNLITGVDGAALSRWAGRVSLSGLVVRAGQLEARGVRRTFGDVAANMPVAYIGSCGTLEVAEREGDAAGAAGLRVGDTVSIYRSERRQSGEST